MALRAFAFKLLLSSLNNAGVSVAVVGLEQRVHRALTPIELEVVTRFE